MAHLASSLRLVFSASLLVAAPFLMGAKGGCGGAAFSTTDAPAVTGNWNITYDDKLGVEVTIGGKVYKQDLGAAGGKFTINHDGKPIEFNLDCNRPEVVCPSEAWPKQVKIEQRSAEYDHQMVVTLPHQSCSGKLVEPAPEKCGAGTNNPKCDKVCDGTVTVMNTEHLGVIEEDGSGFSFLLGAGVASNGVNCILLGVSTVKADLVSTGSAAAGNWTSTGMKNGVVTAGYAGGCLWAGDPNGDKQVEALVIGAGVKFTTGFTGARM